MGQRDLSQDQQCLHKEGIGCQGWRIKILKKATEEEGARICKSFVEASTGSSLHRMLPQSTGLT